MSFEKKEPLSKEAGKGKKIAIVVSEYHRAITQKLLSGALDTLRLHGVADSDVYTAWVPGAFEIPLVAKALSQQKYDAILCFGVIVKGETRHDEYIATEVARGISAVGLGWGEPVMFGVLTVDSLAQAEDRVGGAHGHKGVEAAESALRMIQLLKEIDDRGEKEPRSVGFSGR